MASEEDKQKMEEFEKRLKKTQKNHPECIPIFFMKHPEAPNHIKPPTQPFILFNKNLKIEQAMYSLYLQIEQKGLYFFSPYLLKNQVKYQFLQPGDTVEKVYKRYGRGGYLTLVYSDQQLGMQGMMTMQKWMIRLLVFLGLIWVSLYAYSYYLQGYASGSAQNSQKIETQAQSLGEEF